LQIESERWRRHHKDIAIALELELQAAEHAGDLLVGDLQAQHLAATVDAHAYRLALGQRHDLVVDRAGLAATDVQDQVSDVFQMLGDRLCIDAALETMTGISAEIEPTRAACDSLGPPESRLDVDIGGIERHGRGLASH